MIRGYTNSYFQHLVQRREPKDGERWLALLPNSVSRNRDRTLACLA